MRLHVGPFSRIKDGSQIIEARLLDDKRRLLVVGDTLLFSLVTDPSQTFLARITNLLPHPTFLELYTSLSPTERGHRSIDELLEEVCTHYTKKQEAELGVLGIKLERLL